MPNPTKPLTLELGSLPITSIPPPKAGDCIDYFFRYIRLVPENLAGQLMVEQIRQVQNLFGGLSEAASIAVTAPWTWSLRQVLGHLGDGERVFGYRAARFAAADPTPLTGFDQNVIVDGMKYQKVPIEVLLSEWIGLRLANIMLFSHLRPEQFSLKGTVDGNSMTVSAAAYVIAGHVEHHLAIIRQRLGKS